MCDTLGVRHFRAIISCLLVSSGAACDPGSTFPNSTYYIDPRDMGSDEDVGAGDLGPTPVASHGQLEVVGTEVHDKNGDRIQLAGASSMWLNWETSGYAENATALRWMRNNWHLNVIRAAM